MASKQSLKITLLPKTEVVQCGELCKVTFFAVRYEYGQYGLVISVVSFPPSTGRYPRFDGDVYASLDLVHPHHQQVPCANLRSIIHDVL